MSEDFDFVNIVRQFQTEGKYVDCVRYGEGHINDTFKVTMDKDGREVHYILQKINDRLFPDVSKLMHNIELVTEFCRKSIIARGGDSMRECLSLIRTTDGGVYCHCVSGYYRMYVFIEDATSFQSVRTPRDFYESAVAFGNFANLLAKFDASQLYEVLPDFHNTRIRYAHFLAAVQKDICGRRQEVQREIAWVQSHDDLCGKLVDAIAEGEIPLRVTHNDTKLNNVMLDNRTGKGIAVIDLDTVMPGSLCYDFGDSIRFGCNSAAEDEPDADKVHFVFDLYKTYLEGYLSAVGEDITPHEKELLPWGAVLMTYECGMRFLSDYLEGDIYFKTHREKHNLDRARAQFRLVDEMLACLPEMLAAAKKAQ